jgi:hypothetical protein
MFNEKLYNLKLMSTGVTMYITQNNLEYAVM